MDKNELFTLFKDKISIHSPFSIFTSLPSTIMGLDLYFPFLNSYISPKVNPYSPSFMNRESTMSRDDIFSRWDEIVIYFCLIKKYRDVSEIFFYPFTCTGRDWDWQIPSHCRLRMIIFFNWDEIPHDPISFGMWSGYIFI